MISQMASNKFRLLQSGKADPETFALGVFGINFLIFCLLRFLGVGRG